MPIFNYPCGISGCIQTFKTMSAICSHLQRKHPHFDLSKLHSPDCTSTAQEQEHVVLQWSNDELDCNNLSAVNSTTDNHLVAQKSTALLLLTLKEQHRLTQTAINFSVGQIRLMVSHVFEDVKTSIKDRLSTFDIGECNIDQCFDVDLFQGLETEYSQSKFYRDHFNLVVCLNNAVCIFILPYTLLWYRSLQQLS